MRSTERNEDLILSLSKDEGRDLRDVDDLAARRALEVGRGNLENGAGVAGGGPDRVVLEEVLVDPGRERRRVAVGGDAADRKAGVRFDEVGVGAIEGFADQAASAL